MGQATKGPVSICLLCRSYVGNTGLVRGGLGIFGCRRNLGVFLEYVGVECSRGNLRVAKLRKCIVCEVWFLGESWGSAGLHTVVLEESW